MMNETDQILMNSGEVVVSTVVLDSKDQILTNSGQGVDSEEKVVMNDVCLDEKDEILINSGEDVVSVEVKDVMYSEDQIVTNSGEEVAENQVGVVVSDHEVIDSGEDVTSMEVKDVMDSKDKILTNSGEEDIVSVEVELGGLVDEERMDEEDVVLDSKDQNLTVSGEGDVDPMEVESSGGKEVMENHNHVVESGNSMIADGENILKEENNVGVSNEGVEKNLTISVGEKRVAENSVGVGDHLRGNKKARVVNTMRDMKRVAEIVLVLSAMGNMRGGRSPTNVEKDIMAEARIKLAGLCGGMAPKDIIPRDAVRGVVEDLGLNRQRDQRLSFRPPMMSIKEKLELSKRKMEESKKFAIQSGIYSSQMTQAGSVANNEGHGASVHTNRISSDRPSHIPVAVGGFETTSSTPNQVQSTMVSRAQFITPSERDAPSSQLPRTEAVHFRLDGRSNVSAYASQVRANSFGDHLIGKFPTGSPQVPLGAVGRIGLANKVPNHKVERIPTMGVSQVAPLDTRDRSSAYGGLQAVQQPLPGLNFVQASSTYSNHNEIAKSVQKFLHPRLPVHPSWTPPSTDYMNKSLTCQACKESVNDVESLLVCDACEKGNHIKCLQSYNQMGIPKGEWHCPHCLIQSNGKPLPPKYGRVTRNNTTPKVPSNAAAVQDSIEKVENSDQKVNHPKTTANGNPDSLHPAHVVPGGNFNTTAAADLKTSNSRVQTANFAGSKVKLDDGPPSEHKSLPKDATGSVCAVSSGKPIESPNQLLQSQSHESPSFKPEVLVSDPQSLPKCETTESCLRTLSEAGIDASHSSQTSCSPQDVGKSGKPITSEVSSDQNHNIKVPDSRESSECKPGLDVRKDGQDAAQTVSTGIVGVGNGARDCLKSSLDGLHIVDWVGDILRVVDEKAYYKSCHINGLVYKLQDHALFRSNNGNLRPSKLQALWEDTKSGSKWAMVNSCYFPADLPKVVGRPGSPEINEVYESNHGNTMRAGLVKGPCQVLPPNKFKEESEKRTQSDDETQPIFLCKESIPEGGDWN